MNAPTTKRDLAVIGMEALDRNRVDAVKISRVAGGVSFASALEVMEFAKLMSCSKQAVPKDFRENPGMCLAVAFQAIEWQMSPFQVANKAYVVNDRIAFESMLLHAVIEARAPLKERLDCKYEGEGPERQCIVSGTFLDGATRTYTSPKVKDIRVKNSPLWKDDIDQQLWYYSSRSWCRKWAPDVLLGIYSRDEIEENSAIGREGEPPLPGLHARLAGSSSKPRTEGHQEGHAQIELAKVAGGDADQVILPADPETEDKGLKATEQKPAKARQAQKAKSTPKATPKAKATEKAPKAAKGHPAKSPVQAEATPKHPKDAAQYWHYARDWIASVDTRDNAWARWEGERELRDDCEVPVPSRTELQAMITDRFPEGAE